MASTFTLNRKLLNQEQLEALVYHFSTIRERFPGEINPDGLHPRFGYVKADNRWAVTKKLHFTAPENTTWLDLLAWAEEIGVPVEAFVRLDLEGPTTASLAYCQAIEEHLNAQ